MKKIALVLLLLCGTAFGKVRPPVIDPNACPYPYDPNVLEVAEPMAWLPADVNLSVISQMSVWNKTGRSVAVSIQEVTLTNGAVVFSPIAHTIAPDATQPVPDPNGGFNQSWTWGFTPSESRIHYLLFTASTPSKPHWRGDRRIILVYVEAEDVPMLWVSLLTIRNAQRLWQTAVKEQRPMTKPTLVRRTWR